MANSHFGLPEELRIKILSHLDAVSLVHCLMTCKSIFETIRDSSLLTSTIQLYFDGLQKTGTSIPYADLLEYLQRHHQAWLSLDWVEPVTLQMLHDGRTYDLVGDAFAYTNMQGIIDILSLPTSNGINKYTSQIAMTGMLVLNITMDPTQDMIALLYDDETLSAQTDTRIFRIHIRTISTDIPHPQAHTSCLAITVCSNSTYGNDIQNPLPLLCVTHSILALTLEGPSRQIRVLVWDWITSDLIFDSSVAYDPLVPLLSPRYEFSLLNPAYCLVTCPTNSGSIRLYQFIRSPGVTTPPIHVATLHLPPTSAGTKVLRISTRTGPIMAHTNTHVPFAANDEDRLHVFIMVYDRPRESASLNLFVHQRVFTKYTSRYVHFGEGSPLDIPWTEWGPQNTRIIYPSYAQTERQWRRCIHGQRVVLHPRILSHDDDVRLSRSVEVLDFSLAAVLAAQGILQRSPSSASKPTGVLTPSSTIRLPFFQDDVDTHLPCVSSIRDVQKHYYKYVINEESIMGVKIGPETLLLDIYMV